MQTEQSEYQDTQVSIKELRAIEPQEAAAIQEGYTPWFGGDCPVPKGTLVDVMFSDGDTWNNAESCDVHWYHVSGGKVGDVVAYRLSEHVTETVEVPESETQSPQYDPKDVAFQPDVTDDVFNEKWCAERFLQDSLLKMEERAKEYDQDDGERSMGKTVQAFNVITNRAADRALSESEGWLLMQILKDVRQWSMPVYHHDSALDCVAYSALKAESLARGSK